MTVATTLTSTARAQLVQRIINGTIYALPQYLEYGSGDAPALPTDETTSVPIGSRVTCTVSNATIDTTDDTFRLEGVVTYGINQIITNITIFDVDTVAPEATLVSQLDPGVTTLTISGYGNFPSFPFDAQLGSEVITVVNGNGTNTWTVQRNTNGSPISVDSFPIGTVIVGGNNTSNGNMFLKSSFPGIELNAGDQIQFTIDVQFV